MLVGEIEEIRKYNEAIADFVQRLVDEYEDWFLDQPTSLSMKYHKRDPVMITHVKRTFWFARELCRERGFDRKDEPDRRFVPVILAAALIHDIGESRTSRKGKMEGDRWKFYPQCGYSGRFDFPHPKAGVEILTDFANESEKESWWFQSMLDMVLVHMSHWYSRYKIRMPQNEYEWIVAYSDYMASRGEIILEGIE